jgi:hypothetical protein
MLNVYVTEQNTQGCRSKKQTDCTIPQGHCTNCTTNREQVSDQCKQS